MFLWVRTVPCENTLCRAVVPLYRQTWLRKKQSGYVALRPVPNPGRRRVEFAVVEGSEPDAFGFDPGEGMRGTATKCLCCGTAVPAKYVRGYGNDEGFGQQLLSVICVNPFGTGKLYFIDDSWIDEEDARQRAAEERARTLERELRVVTMDAVIPPTGNAGLATGKSYSTESNDSGTPTPLDSGQCSWNGSTRPVRLTGRCCEKASPQIEPKQSQSTLLCG